MPDIVTTSSASLKSRPRLASIDLRAVAWFSLFVLVGSLVILHPLIVLGCLAAVAALGLCRFAATYVRRANLEFWQVLGLVALSGYILLTRGFENLTIHIGGFPIIIGYVLIYASLALAVFSRRQLIARALKEPPVLCVLALLVLAVLHLVVDIPSYGIWALRDSTMCLDGVFVLLGLAWAMKSNNSVFLARWMMGLFVLNMLYTYTMPWSDKVWSWSPVSGVFLKVPVFGDFSGAGDLLVEGAVFCICVGGYLIKRPSWLMLLLAIGQFSGVAITQGRRTYVGTVVVLIILVLFGETKKFAKLFVLIPSAVIVIFLVTGLGGLKISGRIGEVNLDFFEAHVRSLQTSEGTPGSSVESRFSMADEAFQHFLAHPVLGEGFGQPLLTDIDETNGMVTRMPHNSSLSYLARLGLIGFVIWIAFHFLLIKRFIIVLRQRSSFDDKLLSAFVLWLFLYYVLFMICSLVEAPFEFPSGSVQFYFFMGFALGLMRWNLSDKNKRQHRAAGSANRAEHGLIASQLRAGKFA
ncbi:MAG: O-antigen ligase family protein [Candidatus Sulfotelmatobacter sp.]